MHDLTTNILDTGDTSETYYIVALSAYEFGSILGSLIVSNLSDFFGKIFMVIDFIYHARRFYDYDLCTKFVVFWMSKF